MNVWVAAVALGAVSGMRSLSGLALLARQSRARRRRRRAAVTQLLASPSGRAALQAAAVGEFIFDKLPWVPPRIRPGPLLGRMVAGGICGWWLGERAAGPRARLAVVGSASALAAAHAAYGARRWLTHAAGVQDTVVAMTEDALALGVGAVAARPRA